jgi:hypothetical protein
MVLTKDNSGKYLTKEFHDKFAQGVIDRNTLTAQEIVWTGLPADLGNGKENPDNFKIQSQPIDTFTEATKTLDLRHLKDGGDRGDY